MNAILSSIISLAIQALAAPPAASAPAAPAAPVPNDLQVQSVFDFVVKGGPVMIPIAICSLVALGVAIERLVALRRGRVIPEGFLDGLRQVFRDRRTDRAAAIDYCTKDASPVSAVFAAGIRRLDEPIDLLERHITEAGEREVLSLRVRLRLLSIIASVAPLLGLLGTITGMITAFQTVAASGEALGRTELLAKGIYEAMITTAAGLIVAIPTLLCYHWIAARIDGLVAEIDRMAADFVEEFARPGHAPQPAASPAPHQAADKPRGEIVIAPPATDNGAIPVAVTA